MSSNLFMQKAIEQAKFALKEDEIPVGAVVVLEDQILGLGHNQCIGSNDPTAHAEIIAIRNAARSKENYRLYGSTMYVTLEPCLMCAGALVHSRIKRIVFSTRDPKSGVLVSNSNILQSSFLNHKIEIYEGLLRDESSALLKDFFINKRTKY